MPTRPADPAEGGAHGQHPLVVVEARLTRIAGRGVDYLASSPEGRLLNLLGQTFVLGLLAYAVGRRELRKPRTA